MEPESTPKANKVSSSIDTLKQKKKMSFRAYEELRENHPPTTYCETMMHLFKGNVGTGCYAMADAMMNAGLLLGPILTVVIAVICVHAQHLLIQSAEFIKAENNLSKRPDFAETVELSFSSSKSQFCSRMASTMKTICNVFICFTQLGFCSVFFLFITSNVRHVLFFYGYDISEPVTITIVLIPILLTSLATKLKYIAIFSGIANFCMIVGIILTIGYASEDLPPISDREYFADPMKLPHFFGAALFAFEGIALVLPLQNAMKEPKDFSRPLGVLNVGMVLVSAIYVVVGTIGYWQYGESTEASLTLNLPTQHILAQIVMLMIALGVMLGYPIQFFVAVQIIFPSISESWKFADKNPACAEILFRVLLVLVTFTVAQVVPNLGLLLSLIGCVCCVVLAFVFPALTDLIISHNTPKGIPLWKWIKNIIILLIAFTGFATGGFLSVKEIIVEVVARF